MSTVLNVAGHPIDLDDGRTLAPGEQAEEVDTDHPHNRVLVVGGLATVVEGMTPHKTQPIELVKQAEKAAADNKEGKDTP